jgi:prepilin-type N-terminal cleavage/methylation domain-containing protein
MILHTRTRRVGFSLIELLVVIAIIAILVSLSLAAAMKIITVMPRTQSNYEIGKLQQSLQAAQQAYNGLQTLPSQLVLYNNLASYNSAAPGTPAYNTGQALNVMFGSRFLRSGSTVSWDGTPQMIGAAANPAYLPNASFTLEGDQALVFYLGGIPTTSGGANQCLGFSNNPVDPTAAGGTRIGPFYQFPSSRLIKLAHTTNGNATNAFFSFVDPYQKNQPYAFFGTTAVNVYSADCPTLGVAPYFQGTQFFNPNTFQIISAGADGQFGPGGASWSTTAGALNAPTRDNQSNFAVGTMATGQS